MPTVTNITTAVSGFTIISQHQHPSSHLTVFMHASNFLLNIFHYSDYSASSLTSSGEQNLLYIITTITDSYRAMDITANTLSTDGMN